MKVYSVVGYGVILAFALASAYFAPPHLGPWKGLLVGAAYFLSCWFVVGVYLADVLHLGIAHRSLDYKPWFIKAVTIVNNTFGLYVNPITWVNRHRLHHKYSDHPGDPNKLASDGFWRTMFRCALPYKSQANLAHDRILKSWPFRITANPVFAVVSQVFNFGLLWWAVQNLTFALILWWGMRLFALWVNMVQNYWTHDRAFGYRRYEDAHDNAMNIKDWLPVTATFSACFQNNHHHNPSLPRLSHDESEYDFGFLTVRLLKWLNLCR